MAESFSGLYGIGNLVHKNIEDLVRDCNANCCVGIEVRNHHRSYELKKINTHLDSSWEASFPLIVPESIGPFKKDGFVFAMNVGAKKCSVLMTFWLIPLVTDESDSQIYREFRPEVYGLAIAWSSSVFEKDHQYAVGVSRLSGSEHEIVSEMLFRQETWFTRRLASNEQSIDRTYADCGLKVIASMSNKRKAVLYVDIQTV